MEFPRWLSGKEFTCQAGDLGLIPGPGRSPGGVSGNFLGSQVGCQGPFHPSGRNRGETPTSPTLQDIPQAAGDPCSGWDSDTPSSGSCTTVSPEQVKEIKTEGKRTIVRQGKQVVFRDEDSTGNDEDIMVDSGEWPRGGMLRAGFQGPNLPLPLQGLWVRSLVEAFTLC